MNPADTRVVFMGSPAFAVPSLRALAGAGYSVVAAVSQPDRPAGRGGRLQAPDVKTAALELRIDVFQPETLKDELVQERLRAFGADLFVVAAYGKILPRAVLAMPRRGCLNVHASLLPRWRGASPLAAAILAGDRASGVTIMELVMKMDAGPILAQARTLILPDDTAGSLEPRLAQIGADLLVETFPGWLDGTTARIEQTEADVTYCSLVHKEDGHLRSEMSVEEAERAVRAYNPWPGAYVVYRGERLGIWRAAVEPGEPVEPGRLFVVRRCPAIAFHAGLLVLEEVQRPGSKRSRGEDFVNGERGKLASEVGLA